MTQDKKGLGLPSTKTTITVGLYIRKSVLSMRSRIVFLLCLKLVIVICELTRKSTGRPTGTPAV